MSTVADVAPPAPQRHRVRGAVAAVLVFVAAFGLGASVIGVWAQRTTLNTDKFVSTVTPLQSDPKVQAAVSTYVADQIYTALDVQNRIQTVLPPAASFLAVPLSDRVDVFLTQAVHRVIDSPEFAKLWPQITRTAHTQAMALIYNKHPELVTTEDGKATLNLVPVVNEVLRQLEQQVPTLFGHTINLPDLSTGSIPTDLKPKIESALGVTLPDNFGQVVIYQNDKLGTVRHLVVIFKRSVAGLVAGTLLALALAFGISPNRRRSAVQLGVWVAIVVVALRASIRAAHTQILNLVPAGQFRDAVKSADQIIFSSLKTRGTQLLVLGLVLAAISYVVGPGRGAVKIRAWAVAGWAVVRRGWPLYKQHAPTYAAEHLDPLRIGGVIVASVLALVLSSWSGLFWVLVLLAAYEVGVTLTAGMHPAVEPPAASGVIDLVDEKVPTEH